MLVAITAYDGRACTQDLLGCTHAGIDWRNPTPPHKTSLQTSPHGLCKQRGVRAALLRVVCTIQRGVFTDLSCSVVVASPGDVGLHVLGLIEDIGVSSESIVQNL